jgi:dnd system-associated protein 4
MHSESRFPYYRDSLLFAAAVGFRQGMRVPFQDAAGDPIRYETLTAPGYSEALVNMIAINAEPGDPEILDDARLEERIKIFEEYANGGLDYIQQQINTRNQPVELVIIDLVTQAFQPSGASEQASVEDLLRSISWG